MVQYLMQHLLKVPIDYVERRQNSKKVPIAADGDVVGAVERTIGHAVMVQILEGVACLMDIGEHCLLAAAIDAVGTKPSLQRAASCLCSCVPLGSYRHDFDNHMAAAPTAWVEVPLMTPC